MVTRGNVSTDVPLLSELGKSCQDEQTLRTIFEQLKNNSGNTQQVLNVLIELSKAGIKGSDVIESIAALKLRGGNP